MIRGKKSLLFAMVLTSIFIALNFASASVCGNNIMESGEGCDDGNLESGDGCSALCVFEFCGDVICNNHETIFNCPCDCGNCPIPPFCGDETCNGDETCSTCPGDCGVCPPPNPTCGDHTCNGNETCSTCPGDCGVCPPTCGDGTCNNCETCSTCPGDCGECECESECYEPCFDCPTECTINCNCGNGVLNEGEGCDDGNLENFDGCSRTCYIEEEKEKTVKANHLMEFCEPNWKCTGWSECAGGTMTRECFDDNNCIDEYNRPYETSTCADKILSRAYVENKNTSISHIWIIIEIIIFIILLWILISLFI